MQKMKKNIMAISKYERKEKESRIEKENV